MVNEYTDTGATISEIAGVFFGGANNLNTVDDSVQNASTSVEVGPTVQSTGASREFKFGEPIESRMTQTLVYPRQQRLAFPTYDEEDILYWDVSIVTPPPRPSGTIRVKLKYKGRSKPIPVENPWTE